MTIRNYKKAYWVGRDSYGKMIYDEGTITGYKQGYVKKVKSFYSGE